MFVFEAVGWQHDPIFKNYFAAIWRSESPSGEETDLRVKSERRKGKEISADHVLLAYPRYKHVIPCSVLRKCPGTFTIPVEAGDG